MTVILGNDGVLYGTAEYNGSNNLGELFKLNTDGSGFLVLHTFSGGLSDGAEPDGALLQANDGALYGTTLIGGSTSIFSGGYGTVFKLDTDGGGYKVIYSFSAGAGTNGGLPTAALVQGSDGMLYGTATLYGPNNGGTAFKLATDGSGLVVIHGFGAGDDGDEPQAALVQAKDSFLYGTTFYGGTNQDGMVFKLDTQGSNYADIYDFSAFAPDTSGTGPGAALVQGSDGALYGTTEGSGGGGYGTGTVFKINTDGSSFAVLYSFLTTADANGDQPDSALLQGADGSFYGTTVSGGDMGFGTLFALVASQPPPTLYISQVAGGIIVGRAIVFWPDLPGWTLQQNTNLSNSSGWSASSGVTTSDGTNYLTISPATGSMFFRLTNP